MGVGPIVVNKTVATAGTRIQLFTTATYAASAYFEGLDTNSGSIYLGNATVSSASYVAKLGATIGFSMNAVPGGFTPGPSGGMIDLSKIFIDATASAQVLLVSYMLHVGP